MKFVAEFDLTKGNENRILEVTAAATDFRPGEAAPVSSAPFQFSWSYGQVDDFGTPDNRKRRTLTDLVTNQ
jgi:hypothetical protein